MRTILVCLAIVVAAAGPAAAQSVYDDVRDTLDDPTNPQYGSIKEPCFRSYYGCGGCGPDLLEWIIGPIYCV